MRGQSQGPTSQREARFHGNSENVENARTCARNIGLAAVVGLACVVPLLLTMSPWLLTGRGIDEFATINDLYYSVAIRVSQGQVPYRDFMLKYPIGSLPQIVLPILAGRSVPAYRCAYIAEMLLINALMVQVLAWQVGRREGLTAVPRRLGWYFLCYFFLCRMIVSRIDLVPALLAFLAAVEWFGSRPIVGGILAGLGGLVKIFPVLVAIPAGLRELSRPREAWLRSSIAFTCSSVIGVGLWYLLGGPGLMTSILYHAERGLEIECLYAGSLMILGRLTGEPIVVEPGHGSYELHCAMAPAAVAASRYVQLLALVFALVPFVRSRRRSGVQCAGALILGLILAAPVFSPQFIASARQLVRRFRDQAALRTGSGNLSGSARSRRQASSSPFRRAASSAARASTPCGDQLIPWCLQRADTAQSLYFSTRVLAIHNPARCRCW